MKTCNIFYTDLLSHVKSAWNFSSPSFSNTENMLILNEWFNRLNVLIQGNRDPIIFNGISLEFYGSANPHLWQVYVRRKPLSFPNYDVNLLSLKRPLWKVLPVLPAPVSLITANPVYSTRYKIHVTQGYQIHVEKMLSNIRAFWKPTVLLSDCHP